MCDENTLRNRGIFVYTPVIPSEAEESRTGSLHGVYAELGSVVGMTANEPVYLRGRLNL